MPKKDKGRPSVQTNTFVPLEQEKKANEEKAREEKEREQERKKVEKRQGKFGALKSAIKEILITEQAVAGAVNYGCMLRTFRPLGALLNAHVRSQTEPTEMIEPEQPPTDRRSSKKLQKQAEKERKRELREAKKNKRLTLNQPVVREQPKTKSGNDAPTVVKNGLQLMCDIKDVQMEFTTNLEKILQDLETANTPQQLAKITLKVDKLLIAYLKQNMKQFIATSKLNVEYKELQDGKSPKLEELYGVAKMKYDEDKKNGKFGPTAQYDLQSIMMVLVQRLMRYPLQVDAINDYFHPAHTEEQAEQQRQRALLKNVDAKIKGQAFFHADIDMKTWKKLAERYQEIARLARKPNSDTPEQQEDDKKPTPTQQTPTQVAEDTPPTIQSDKSLSLPPRPLSPTPSRRHTSPGEIQTIHRQEDKDDTDDEDETDDETDDDEAEEEDETM